MIPESFRQQCWTPNDWIYIKGLSKAIDNVPMNYIRESDDKSKYHLERIFSYELYYRWSRLLENEDENPEKLMLNAELSKHYFDKDRCKFPDMVLHGDYTNYEKQYIICEIKSSRYTIKDYLLKKDMESLYGGVKNLNYHCGVFIYLGDRVDVVISKLRVFLCSFARNEEKKFLFIGVKGGKSHYEII